MKQNKLRVIQVSESEFSVQGHGVHTAFTEITHGLRSRGVQVLVNKFWTRADVRHIHTIGPYSLLHLLFGSGKKVVSVHVIPASFVGSIKGARLWLPLATRYLRWFYGRADMLFAVSATVANELRITMKLGKKRIEVFYNTIDMSHYHTTAAAKQAARKRLGIDSKAWVVIGNGQVQPRKRLDTFYEVAKSLPGVQFIWIGGIPFKQLGADYAAMKDVMENPPKNCTVTGVIEHAKVKDYLQAADVFFLPAEQENHPMCVLEAAGAGLPIILRDLPEYDDTFRGSAYMMKSAKMATDEIRTLHNDHQYYKQRQVQTAEIARRFDSAEGAKKALELYAG